jgi:hypothetical protein
MNPTLTLIVTTLLLIAPLAGGGSIGGKFSLSGAWAGYNAPGGPGSTGGEFFLNLETGGKAGPTTPVSGLIQVPNLREGTIEFKPITGTLSAKGVIRAKFQGGTVRGRLDRGGHDARGSVHVNTHRFWAMGFWFADDGFTSPPTDN